MKKNMLFFLIMMMFMPLVVNAEEYYLGNLKLGQRFENGDIIYRLIQREEFLEDADTLNNLIASEKHPHLIGTDIFGRMYGINFVIDDTINPCSGSCPSFSFSHYPDGKEYYWTLESYEELSTLEAAAVYFQTHEKKPNVSIINLVNDIDKYVAKKDEVLKYSVKVKNNGDGTSLNNIIVTNIPRGLFIIENKISDNGTYDEDNNKIEWKMALLMAEQEYTFEYYAKVISDDINEYVGNSYITSSQIQEQINSDNTTVKVQKNIEAEVINPKTGVTGYIVILIILLSISSSLYIILKKKKDYLLK